MSNFWVCSGQARYDLSKAVILDVADTLEEAIDRLEIFPGAVIVSFETQKVVYDPGFVAEQASIINFIRGKGKKCWL